MGEQSEPLTVPEDPQIAGLVAAVMKNDVPEIERLADSVLGGVPESSTPVSQLVTSQVGLRDLPDPVQGLVLFSTEAALASIAMRRGRGERVSDQAETLAVIDAVFNALGLFEVQGAETCTVHLDGIVLETGDGFCDMADDAPDVECGGGSLYRLAVDIGDSGDERVSHPAVRNELPPTSQEEG